MTYERYMNGYQHGKSYAAAFSAVHGAMRGQNSVIVCANAEGKKRRHDNITAVLSQTTINYVATNTTFYLEGAGQITLEVL